MQPVLDGFAATRRGPFLGHSSELQRGVLGQQVLSYQWLAFILCSQTADV